MIETTHKTFKIYLRTYFTAGNNFITLTNYVKTAATD